MITEWLGQHVMLVGSLTAGSTILLLLSIVATPWIVARLPEDYLLQRDGKAPAHPLIRVSIDALRTLFGAALVSLGVLMLVIPGPGLITLLMGLSIARFPGKHRLLRYVASRETVYSSLNWMRKRYGKPPLLHPHREKL